MEFTIDKKTGFYTDGKIVILCHGLPFYVSTKETTFNLPKGIYEVIDGRIQELPCPITYIVPKLAPPTRKARTPEKLEIIVEPNPHKCTFDLNKGLVKIDPEFVSKGKAFLSFIFGHEIGHLNYLGSRHDENGELKCDKFSAKMLIDEGYNPSQLFFAQNLCLTHSPERKEKFENFLNNIKIKR
jgi:hypothetical protein